MLSRYDAGDWSRAELRRRMVHWLDELEAYLSTSSLFGGTREWPRMSLSDGGDKLFIHAEVPGLSEKDVEVSVEQDLLTISAERHTTPPEGYVALRQERPDYKFVQSFTLPCKVNAEKAVANVQNGILMVAIPKSPEAQPRRIEIRTS